MSWGRERELLAALKASGLGGWLESETGERLNEVLGEAERITEALRLAFPTHFGSLDTGWHLRDRMIDEQEILKPFIQTMAEPMTTKMRTMVLALMLGGTVVSLSVEYRRQAKATVSISVELQNGERCTFESEDLWDFEVLRHLGLMKAGGRPVIDGYYAFRSEA